MTSTTTTTGELTLADEFPASRRCRYLNAASVALMYSGAERAAIDWQHDLAQNGTMNFDEVAEATVFDGLHRAAAGLLGAAAEDIAVASSASELLCSLAWAILPGPGSNIVSTEVAFPSTVYPWTRVARQTGSSLRLAAGDEGHVHLDNLLELIDDDTAVVCLSHVEYGSGQCYDLGRVAQKAHDHDALLVVDATQSAGAVPIDVAASSVDALVCAGYKWLCGPFGVAILYLAPHLRHLEPGLVGFRSHKDLWDLRADRFELPSTARRFEFSTMAYGCAVALTASIDFLLQIGIDRIHGHNLSLADRLIAGLRQQGAEIMSPTRDDQRTSIVGARFPLAVSAEVVRRLGEAKIIVSPRGETVRFSPHLYNRADDIDAALAELQRILR